MMMMMMMMRMMMIMMMMMMMMLMLMMMMMMMLLLLMMMMLLRLMMMLMMMVVVMMLIAGTVMVVVVVMTMRSNSYRSPARVCSFGLASFTIVFRRQSRMCDQRRTAMCSSCCAARGTLRSSPSPAVMFFLRLLRPS